MYRETGWLPEPSPSCSVSKPLRLLAANVPSLSQARDGLIRSPFSQRHCNNSLAGIMSKVPGLNGAHETRTNGVERGSFLFQKLFEFHWNKDRHRAAASRQSATSARIGKDVHIDSFLIASLVSCGWLRPFRGCTIYASDPVSCLPLDFYQCYSPTAPLKAIVANVDRRKEGPQLILCILVLRRPRTEKASY